MNMHKLSKPLAAAWVAVALALPAAHADVSSGTIVGIPCRHRSAARFSGLCLRKRNLGARLPGSGHKVGECGSIFLTY